VTGLQTLGATELRQIITVFRDAMKVHAPSINRLNVYPVPDGDTGTNMFRTLEAVVAELSGAEENLAASCAAISHGSLMGARGNSGVILSQILRGLASTMCREESSAGISASVVSEAFTRAAAAAYEAVLKPIEGTILTVVRETAEGGAGAARNFYDHKKRERVFLLWSKLNIFANAAPTIF
jgi:dihydroxyacetone kinase-like predicted kinase